MGGAMIILEDNGGELPPDLAAKCDGLYTLEVVVEEDGTLTAVGVLDESRPYRPTAKPRLAMRVPQADFAAKPFLVAAPRRPRQPDDPPHPADEETAVDGAPP